MSADYVFGCGCPAEQTNSSNVMIRGRCLRNGPPILEGLLKQFLFLTVMRWKLLGMVGDDELVIIPSGCFQVSSRQTKLLYL